jgi:hypothetical protein
MVAEGSRQSVGDLVALAQARFGALSQAELKLLRAAPKGEVAWCGPNALDIDPANDPAKADEWGPGREIRADLIRWLCKDRDAATAVDPTGIQVHAARITGGLHLSYVSVLFPLSLCRCRLTDNANLISADLPALDLAGSWARSVTADGAHVRGAVFLNNGFRAEGEVRLLGAQIGGDLDCRRGTFKNPGKGALSSHNAKVQGGIYLREGFSAEGAVGLLGAQIGGDLDCSGGTFKNPGGNALTADGANVKGSVVLREGFRAEGEVRLLGAQIGINLDCSGGTFKNPGGNALTADGANVKGSVVLREGFRAEGAVRLLGAQIGGDLACRGGIFRNPGKDALCADGANVKGEVFLSDRLSAEGEVRLLGAQIEGDLDCRGGRLSEVTAQNAAISGTLFWQGVEATSLDLINASAGSLVDDEKSWPAKGNLFLDGFVYGHISGNRPRDAKTRLRWLALQPEFKPQPYNQLARVLREAGHARGARRVLYEMESRRRKAEDQGLFSRLMSRAFKTTLGYGYYPHRIAVGGLVFLITMGWWLFRQGYFAGAVVPTDRDAYYCIRTHGRPPDHYQPFTAFIYSLENSVPLFNLGQKDLWTADPSPRGSRRWADFLRAFRWCQIVFGWLFSTLFVAGVTGVVRKE